MRPTREDERSRSVARSGIRPTNQKSSETVAYVETANTSQISGLRNCGHTPMEFGYGNSQYASHGRPVWKSGKMPAHATANSVIASAKRLIDVRHVCRSSRRIAEMSVPAWPMPIHQTKFVMSNAQATGWLLPQMPMPLTTRYPSDTSSSIVSRHVMPNPAYQPSGGRPLRTMELVLSVTDPNV